MSIDLYSTVRFAANLIALGILAIGLFRAVEMGRGLVNRLYRGRAFWTAAVMLEIIIVLSVDYIVGTGGPVTVILFVTLFMVLFVFADRTIQVAVEMDFFHRNTLHWRQVRKLLYVVVLADVVYFIVGSAEAFVYPPIAFGTVLGAFGVTIVAAAVSARRAPDRTIKRHVRLLWVFLVSFLVALNTSQPGLAPAWGVVSNLFIVVVAYSLFLMVMSLSLVGRVEKGEGSNLSPLTKSS